MIFDSLENFDQYLGQHRNFKLVAQWLASTDLKALSAGRHDILGDGEIYVNVQDDVELKAFVNANPEFHRRYIDVQVVLQGVEVMGWQPLPKDVDTKTEFDCDKDVGFLKAESVSWTTVPAGYFTVFFPQDVHAPCCGIGKTKKLVVKVRID